MCTAEWRGRTASRRHYFGGHKKMTSTSVEREQYEITDRGITHTPTGYSFTPYPGNSTSGTVKMGRLG